MCQAKLVSLSSLCSTAFFSSLWSSNYQSLVFFLFLFLFLFIYFLLLNLIFARTAKSIYGHLSLFFFKTKYPLVWSSGWDQMIHLYRKIPENFMYLIFSDGFWFVNIWLYGQISISCTISSGLPSRRRLIFSLTLLLCPFATFVCYGINRFVSVTT